MTVRFAPLAKAALAASLVAFPATAQPQRPAKPPPSTQVQKSTRQRGGIDPCNTPDPGFAGYRRWVNVPVMGQALVPQKLPDRHRFDVMLHFHGHEAVRKEWVKGIAGPVLVGIDLGTGSLAYEKAFSDPRAFQRLLASVEEVVSRVSGQPGMRARHVGLSAWSAGYGSIGRILAQPFGRSRVDSVVLLDGLHTGYDEQGGIAAGPLRPFVDFARVAAAGRRLMFFSHSSIIPPGYASTTETAQYLVQEVGGRTTPAARRETDPMGLELVSYFLKGSFHVRGFAGNDKPDHCAHIGLFRDVLKFHLVRRWR